MSMNYYSVKRCDHCGHSDILHIGKSATGWCFALATHPTKYLPGDKRCPDTGAYIGEPAGIRSLEDWQRFLQASTDRHIENEYGDEVSYDMLMSIITKRDADRTPLRNWGERCIGHGPGTWDLMAGDFS